MLEIQSSSRQMEVSSEPGQRVLGAIEFGDKTMTMATPLAPVTMAVTYSRDGDNYLVTAAMGQAFSFQTESGGIKSVSPECHLVPNN
jgi:hypothetical protein